MKPGACLLVLFFCTALSAAENDLAVLEQGSDTARKMLAILQPVLASNNVSRIPTAELKPWLDSSTEQPILLIPDANHIDMRAIAPLSTYLDRGGRVCFLGSQPFAETGIEDGGKWVSLGEMFETQAKQSLKTPAFDLVRAFASKVVRDTNNPQSSSQIGKTIGVETGDRVRVEIHDYDGGWDNFATPTGWDGGEGVVALGFWTLAGRDGTTFTLELSETDGSRWIATIHAGYKKRFAYLTPQDFQYWGDNASKNRGLRDDHVRFSEVTRASVGVSKTHGAGTQKAFLFEISNLFPLRTDFQIRNPPWIDGLSPALKRVEMPSAREGFLATGETVKFALPVPASGPLRRLQGHAGQVFAPYRQVPLATVKNERGELFAGTLWLESWSDARKRARQFAWVSVTPPLCYDNATSSFWTRAVALALGELRQPASIISAGPARVALNEGEAATFKIKLGLPHSPPPSSAVHLQIKSLAEKKILEKDFEVTPSSGSGECTFAETLPSGEYEAAFSLKNNGPSQRLVTRFFVEPAQLPSIPRITVKNGTLWRDDKPWFALGVNYWPLTAVGSREEDWSGHWLMPEFYDPLEAEADLQLLEQQHVNSVSIQYHHADEGPALRDFLARCRRHNIYVNLFISGLYAWERQFDQIPEKLTAARLPEQKIVFACDIAWEPNWGMHNRRNRFNDDWRDWVECNYGSIEHAEIDWQFPAWRDGSGNFTNPTDRDLSIDGPHRTAVAAYRRFIDSWVSLHYGEIRRFLRGQGIDALLGARTGYGGTGNSWADRFCPFDLQAGARHLDLTSVEGWHLNQDATQIRRGGFIAAYGKFASRNRAPVIWLEFGSNVLPYSDATLESKQAQIYRDMFQMVCESGSSGYMGWWFPGGVRIDENSDMGIVTQTREPRASFQLYPQFSKNLPPKVPAGEPLVQKIDRDADARGISALVEKHQEAYLNAVDTGHPYQIVESTTPLTSDNFPEVAVGGVPLTAENPSRFLWGELERLEIEDAHGKQIQGAWNAGMKIKVSPGPVKISMVFGNLGGCRWLGAEHSKQPITLRVKTSSSSLAPLAQDVAELDEGTFTWTTSGQALIQQGNARYWLDCAGHKFAFTPPIQWTP